MTPASLSALALTITITFIVVLRRAGTAAFTAWSVIPFGGEVEIFGVKTRLQLTDLPIPGPVPAEITLADVAAALRDPLANLTTSSASTTVRTAILNQRAALDALLAQLDAESTVTDEQAQA